MKTKIIFTALLLIAAQLTAQAEENRDMFTQLSEHRGVTSVFISRALLNMVSNFNTGGADIRSLAGRLTQIEIYSTNGNADANRIMREGMEALIEQGTYELLMRIRDDDTNVVFYAREEEGFFRDLLMYIRDGNDYTLIRLMGRFTAEDIQGVMDSVNNENNQQQGSATFDEGVIIEGVRWATRNVAAPGTFAETPECSGMLFQWNRKKAWNAVDEEVEGWGSSMPAGISWTRANDPCPQGWRVPTEAEFRSLIDAGSTWTTRNGVNGRLYGIAPNQLFLPAAGWWGGSLSGVGATGIYWSSTQSGTNTARSLFFNFSNGIMLPGNQANRLSIRCVAE